MTRELLLLRHGKSDWDTGVSDFKRPLKDRGKRSAQRMGAWLQQQELRPGYVLSSPALRALETARKCVKSMGLAAADVHEDERIYAASPRQLRQVLADCPADSRRLMLVGHNPGCEELLIWLLGDRLEMPSDGKLMPTATLARLEMPDDWGSLQRGCARLIEQIRPRELPKKFPFAGPDGPEFRDRPAYYYRQSSVIPYRVEEGELQILVVSSSSKRHWVVPKGIHDPGLTAQQSAANEALEEAGVKGDVPPESLGSYRYPKWGAECTVAVYAMRVNEVIDDRHWEERHRGRKWLPANEAVSYLKQEALGPLIRELEKQVGR